MRTIKVKMTVEVPQVPNFLRTSDGQTIPLCAVSDVGLRELAREWTENLIARSLEQSKETVIP